MDTANMIALVSVTIAGIGTVIGMLRFVASTADTLRKECIDALKDGLRQEVHSRANALQPLSTWLGRVEIDVSELQRETVRRADLAAFESRLTRLDNKMDGFGDKLDAFKDAVLARISGAR